MLLAACMTALLLSSGGFRNTAMAAETETEIPTADSGTTDQDPEGKKESWSVPAEKIEEARTLDTSHVADASDMTTVEELEESGNTVSADMLEDGVYEIGVESSSSMFKIGSVLLTVENGSSWKRGRSRAGGRGTVYLF